MKMRYTLAVAIVVLGASITLVNLIGGSIISFPMLLGVLLLADGVLRFSALAQTPGDTRHAGDH